MILVRAAFICSKACDSITEDTFSVASQHSSELFSSISRQRMTRTQRAIFADFRTEIGRSQKSHFLFLNIARRPQITQSDLVFFNLSGASCIFGHVDINEVIYFHACRGQIRQSQLVPVRSPRLLDRVLVLIHLLMGSLHSMPKNEKNQGGCNTEQKRGIFQVSFSKAKYELLLPGQSGLLRTSPPRKSRRTLDVP